MTIRPAIAAPGCGCDRVGAKKGLLSIDEALALVTAHVPLPSRTEVLSIAQATGRILARPVRSSLDAPPFDNSAMDGYAVQSATLTGPGPWSLDVVARVPAGHGAATAISAGQAARIFTGAPIPPGADAVVMQEDVTRASNIIHLCQRPAAGVNIRKAGCDLSAGAIALEQGRRLGPRDIAACAAAGAGFVHVRPRLQIALVVTGDELRQPGDVRDAAQIWDINTPMLSAMLDGPAIDLASVSQAADNRAALSRQLADLAATSDLVVTTGGISVGEEDHVKPALLDIGAEILFSGVAVKPGKPVSFGRIGRALWLGLPGNPLSAFVTWQIFGTAVLRCLTGQVGQFPRRRHVVTSEPISRKPGRCELRPATILGFDAQGREVVRFQDATHSARVGLLPASDGLMFLPAEVDDLPAGALVEFQPFCDA